jgi:hypothetical protein
MTGGARRPCKGSWNELQAAALLMTR